VRRDGEAVEIAQPLPVDAADAGARERREDVPIREHDEAAFSAGMISFSSRSAKSVAYNRTKVSLLSVLLDLASSIVGCMSGDRVQPVSTTP
jgi:hypothetical protein